jgi:hypothetical protein
MKPRYAAPLILTTILFVAGVFFSFPSWRPAESARTALCLAHIRRTVCGGPWYSATSAPLYLPYRDAFQPETAAMTWDFTSSPG